MNLNVVEVTERVPRAQPHAAIIQHIAKAAPGVRGHFAPRSAQQTAQHIPKATATFARGQTAQQVIQPAALSSAGG